VPAASTSRKLARACARSRDAHEQRDVVTMPSVLRSRRPRWRSILSAERLPPSSTTHRPAARA
jgi:hypothetical protein